MAPSTSCPASHSPPRILFVVVLPFFSGLAALIYELLWFRRLGLVFGNTVQAAATVMTAYMAGLALGAHTAGRLAPSSSRPGRAFALLELGIGIYALAIPALFALIRLVYCALYPHVTADSTWLTAARLVLGLAVLVLPTCLMGATLPVLSRAVLPQRNTFGSGLGLLYGANTAGAVVGTLLAGFVLIPRLGLHGANVAAVLLSIFVGVTAFVSARKHTVNPSAPSVSSGPAPPRTRIVVPLAGMALSGFLALALEVTWFRTLVLVFGSTTYSFTVMLAVFLLGLSLGSTLCGWVCDRVPRPMAVFGLLCVLIGIFTQASMRAFTGAPFRFLEYLSETDCSWRGIIAAKVIIAAAFLLVPSVGFGGAFTAGARAVRNSFRDSARAVGVACTVNTVGAALGAVLAGFVLLPLLGIETALVTLGRGALLIGALALLSTPATRRGRWAIGVPLLLMTTCVFAVRTPAWDRQILASGPYFAPLNYRRKGVRGLKDKIASERLLYYAEGKTALVTVAQGGDENLYFLMDGKVEADTTAKSMVLQRLMGHLPMLFHPNPRRVLNIGFGAGVTLGALNVHAPDLIDVVELEPCVREAARIWGKRNHDVTADPHVRMIVNDGRNHVLATRQRYDVIASDPFEPVVAGAAGLYSVDHFSMARERLAPHGLMAQFLPLYELSRNDFLAILRSFAAVFPNCAVFFTGCDTILLGARDSLHLDMERVAERMRKGPVAASLQEVGFTSPASILGTLVVQTEDAHRLAGPGPVNTDERPLIEFSAPRSALNYTADENQKILAGIFAPLPPSLLSSLDPHARNEARNMRKALRLVLAAGMARATDGPPKVAEGLLEQAAAAEPGSPLVRGDLVAMKVALAFRALAAGQPDAASLKLREALAAAPSAFMPLYYLALHAMSKNDLEQAGEYLFRGLSAYPDSPLLLAVRARLCARRGDLAGACRDIEAALEQLPRRVALWDDYAVCLSAIGRTEEAGEARTRAAELRAWLDRPH